MASGSMPVPKRHPSSKSFATSGATATRVSPSQWSSATVSRPSRGHPDSLPTRRLLHPTRRVPKRTGVDSEKRFHRTRLLAKGDPLRGRSVVLRTEPRSTGSRPFGLPSLSRKPPHTLKQLHPPSIAIHPFGARPKPCDGTRSPATFQKGRRSYVARRKRAGGPCRSIDGTRCGFLRKPPRNPLATCFCGGAHDIVNDTAVRTDRQELVRSDNLLRQTVQRGELRMRRPLPKTLAHVR